VAASAVSVRHRLLGHRLLGVVLLLGLAVADAAAQSATAPAAAAPPEAILQDLKALRECGRVLYVAAHPDDENTQLITYLARGRGYRTAYLSLTRGDGGQNVIGPEFGDALGLIRTHELLTARRLDSGQQFFSRALDFGFSKDYRETLKFWDQPQVVADIVRIIRTFRPDVIVTRFSPEPGGTHGHHTASARLAVEAFALAADPNAYPQQLAGLAPWRPKRVVQNGRGGGGVSIDVSGTDSVLGQTYARIASRSRGMHKSQGFGDNGGGNDRGPRLESFQHLAGEPATKDLLDDVDTTWARFPDGAAVVPQIDQLIATFNPADPVASVPLLLDLRKAIAALPADPVIDEKRRQLDGILQACVGLSVITTIPQSQFVAGERLPLRHTVSVRSNVPVRWVGVRYPSLAADIKQSIDLRSGQPATQDSMLTLPLNTPITQPYWLRETGTSGMSQVSDPNLIGRPINPPAVPVEFVFDIGGQTVAIPDEPITASTATDPDQAARLEVIPPVSLEPVTDVRLFQPGGRKSVEIVVIAARAGVAGQVVLPAPQGWTVEPSMQPFRLTNAGDRAKVSFTVTAPAQASTATLAPVAEISGTAFGTRRVEIRYAHLPPLLLQPAAQVKAVSVDLKTAGRRVGYLPGAGDSVAESLGEMGFSVTQLAGADLTAERLSDLDAVVIGVRAFNVRTDLVGGMPALFAFVENGGNVIVQYNRPDGLRTNALAPFPLKLSRDRVTDETSVVTLLAPDHPVLNTPNKITAADFDGWVQERGIYYPNEWDDRFTAILASGDAGEAPLKGGLLIARHGKGYFVYTGLAWFRQLPAGVPGAYRLFANMVSLGQ
jgi:LmbE family N-acetylglucosaminyl deacetylase